MRKYWWIVLLILMVAQGASAGPLQKIFKQKDAGRFINLKRNMVAVFEFEGNPSTGHVWEPGVAENGSVRVLGRTFIPADKNLLGSPGVERIYIAGARKGNIALSFALKRAYARKEALKQLTFNIESEGRFAEKFEIPKLNLSADESGGIQEDGSTEMAADTTISAPSIGLPQAFNWCDEYGCTPIKDQGNCGACWAFSTAGVLENIIKFKDGKTTPLSEQYLISCNNEGYSCYGGWWAHEYHQWKTVNGEREAGAVSQASKPYLGKNGSCNAPNAKVAKIVDWGYVGYQNGVPSTDAIKQAIYEYGPVAAAVCVNYAFSYYSGGVFSGPGCSRVNHGVILVGWNDAGGYWILRNSYGSRWGENGYMRIKYGVSNVGWGASWVDYQGSSDLPTSGGSQTTDPSYGCDEGVNSGCN